MWDNGLPVGGNYWSDYHTVAQGCNDGNGDGFCDDPYNIPGGGGSQDRYAFVYISPDSGGPDSLFEAFVSLFKISGSTIVPSFIGFLGFTGFWLYHQF